ncbi:hypothetical protein [Streptomyces sp. NPDC014006]|uniref:hypothetical protein n=1 Tax=Streptomyces sp. NPDC014006 TaxID=3364870 RepID=UPI0036FE7B90
MTDNRSLRSPGFTTLVGAELHAPRTEAGPSWHIVAVSLPRRAARSRRERTRASPTGSAGAFIGLAPPASLLTATDADSLDAELHDVRLDRGHITVRCSPAPRLRSPSKTPCWSSI